MEEHDPHLLARIDERVQSMQIMLSDLKNELDEYTRLSRFMPVEKAVFGIIAMISVSLIGIAVVKLFGGHS